MPEGSFVVVQPEAGIARADKALAAFAAELDVREDARVRPDELDADVVVVTAGSWVNELLDEPLPVKTTRETLCYFRPEGGRPIPSVVSFKPGRHTHEMYSLTTRCYGLKVGAHHAGPEADPNVPGEPEPGADRAHHRLGERRPTGWPTPSRSRAETCMYTTTADESFILERRGRVVVGSPCSGHGFKFAPAIGERLADLATRSAA